MGVCMDARNELKGKRGLVRLLNATRYSLAGYKAAWQDEEAFRQICLLAVIGLPAGAGLGGIRPAGRAAGALPAGGTAQQRHRERGGPYFAGMASAGQEGQGYGERRPIHGPAFPGCRLGRLRFGTIIGRCGQGNLWLRPTGSIFVLRGKVEGHLRYRTGLPPYSFPGITAHPVTGPFGHPYRAL